MGAFCFDNRRRAVNKMKSRDDKEGALRDTDKHNCQAVIHNVSLMLAYSNKQQQAFFLRMF